jgi:hypothetical protein
MTEGGLLLLLLRVLTRGFKALVKIITDFSELRK